MPARRTYIETSRGQMYRRDLETQIVIMRDAGWTLQQIADHYGLATRQQVRAFWVAGLRRAGRSNEIQTREIQMVVNGQQVTVVSNDLDGTFEFLGDGWTTFGAELECMTIGQSGACSALRRANLSADVTGYTHDTVSYWKMTYDGSISGAGAVEAVSPVLSGNDGLRELRTAMMALREGGARVNASCGGHVHIGVDGWLSLAEQVRVIHNWYMVNQAIEMLVLSRRRNHPRWCKRMTKRQCEYYAAEFASGNRTGYDRYYDLNIASFAKYGTFEHRLHQGTLNGKNHTAWVIFTQAVMKFLATADSSELVDLWESGDGAYHSPEHGTLIEAVSRRALERLLTKLVEQSLISEEVAIYLRGRAEWISRRGRSSTSQAV